MKIKCKKLLKDVAVVVTAPIWFIPFLVLAAIGCLIIKFYDTYVEGGEDLKV